jgi:hypothetical protein
LREQLEAVSAEQGRGFMSYQKARARLQRVLTDVAATGPPAIMKTVFEGQAFASIAARRLPVPRCGAAEYYFCRYSAAPQSDARRLHEDLKIVR